MPSIQIRAVPDHIYHLLVQQAEKEHRSIAQQTLAVLARGLEVDMDPGRGVNESSKEFAPQAAATLGNSATRQIGPPEPAPVRVVLDASAAI